MTLLMQALGVAAKLSISICCSLSEATRYKGSRKEVATGPALVAYLLIGGLEAEA